MKKLFFMALAAAMAGATALTSCGSDDNDITPATKKAVSGNISIMATFSEDFIKCCDINMFYTDDQGKEQKISAASLALKDTIMPFTGKKIKVCEMVKDWEYLPLPTTKKYYFTCTLKDNLPAQDSVIIVNSVGSVCTINYDNGAIGIQNIEGSQLGSLPSSSMSIGIFKDKGFAKQKKILEGERTVTVQ